jgi:hypothetical protein
MPDHDLSRPDPHYVTPIPMGASQLWQQWWRQRPAWIRRSADDAGDAGHLHVHTIRLSGWRGATGSPPTWAIGQRI